MLRVRIDLNRCIGAATCMVIAPTAFGWRKGQGGKADVLDLTTIEDDVLREAALACPTQAILLEEVADPAGWTAEPGHG
jgi:ferredoxin